MTFALDSHLFTTTSYVHNFNIINKNNLYKQGETQSVIYKKCIILVCTCNKPPDNIIQLKSNKVLAPSLQFTNLNN